MNNSKYIKVLLVCAVMMVFVWQAWAQIEPQEDEEKANQDVGRFDPFERLSVQQKVSGTQKVVQQGGSVITVPELYAKSVLIKFLDAKNLKVALANMTTEYGVITADRRSNSLIICDTEENLERILDEIKKADKTPQQIMVEVVILDVKLDDDTKLGIHWDVLLDDRYNAVYGQYVNSSWPVGDVLSTAAFQIVTGNITNLVYAIQEKRDVEILASPRVMVVSGKSSSIEAIEEIPYLESSQSSESQTVLTYTEFKDVGIKLKVTATLTDDNDVVLEVSTEQNVQTGTSGNVPVVDTRKANTSLLLSDGQIVVMAGLRREEKTLDVEQIPILGDLPLIGGLFRGTNSIVKHSELVVFISPHIYKGESISRQELEKFNRLKNRPLLKLPDNKRK